MAFSPPAMTVTKRILYGIAVGIAVVGGENRFDYAHCIAPSNGILVFLLRFGNEH
jgi:hypothetical protein